MTRLFTLALASVCFLGASCAHMKKKSDCTACDAKAKAKADSCCATPAKGDAPAAKKHKH